MSTKSDDIGRIGRGTFFWMLLVFFASMILFVIFVQSGVINETNIVEGFAKGQGIFGKLGYFNFSVYLFAGIFIFHIVTVIARLHDRDLSGYLSIAALVPLVNFVLYFYLLIMPGTPGSNRFGNQ